MYILSVFFSPNKQDSNPYVHIYGSSANCRKRLSGNRIEFHSKKDINLGFSLNCHNGRQSANGSLHVKIICEVVGTGSSYFNVCSLPAYCCIAYNILLFFLAVNTMHI